MRFINGIFSNKCGFVHGLFHFVLTIIGQDKKFGDMCIHKKDDPLFDPLADTLMKKFDEAVPRATAVITAFFGNIRQSVESNTLANDMFRYDYSGRKGE